MKQVFERTVHHTRARFDVPASAPSSVLNAGGSVPWPETRCAEFENALQSVYMSAVGGPASQAKPIHRAHGCPCAGSSALRSVLTLSKGLAGSV
jgi:hypothetical protein